MVEEKTKELLSEYLSKKKELEQVFAELKNAPKSQKKEIGKRANLIKSELKILDEKRSKIQKNELYKSKINKGKIDISIPGIKIKQGHLHPLTLVQREIKEIFQTIGFSVVEGPEMETEKYNFDALNVPKDHTARDMWDTFWLKEPKNSKFKIQNSKLLLRTHTSPVQIRFMEKRNPPLRIIAPGRVFRYEATDASHEINFYQIEGLMVDKNISAANFKAIIEEFLKRFFKTSVEIRLRPSYFPFTEPSFEIDIKRKGGKWLEMMGAGMVHPNVLKSAGLNAKDWQGFAFGVGTDRLAMLKYKVDDIRLFYQNDLRFLNQF